MHLGVLTLDLHLEGCQSLKEKRARTRGVRDRFGRLSQVAVCESDFSDGSHIARYRSDFSDPRRLRFERWSLVLFLTRPPNWSWANCW